MTKIVTGRARIGSSGHQVIGDRKSKPLKRRGKEEVEEKIARNAKIAKNRRKLNPKILPICVISVYQW